LLSLPKLYSAYSSDNIALVVLVTMQLFGVDAKKVSYFVLNNAYNNNIAIAALVDKYSFKATY
jgi:hypothetical protein